MMRKEGSFHRHLKLREVGLAKRLFKSPIPVSLAKKLNKEYGDICRYTDNLRDSIQSKEWSEIEHTLTDVLSSLVDHGGDGSKTTKKNARELFVAYGGMEEIQKVLVSPISPEDARSFDRLSFRDKFETWNELLIVIRESLVSLPTLPDSYFDTRHIVFLFTLLGHTSVFESAVNAIEEILACREDPFPLFAVPKFFSLLRGLSSRHFAHFCRILSLTVFEPEDRQIVEGVHVLRSVDLLRIRRSRLVRSHNSVIEKNQSLVIEMPEFLPRLVQILQVVNHGPDLSEMIRRNLVAQVPITTDVFHFTSASHGLSDWEHFAQLERLVNSSGELGVSGTISSASSSVGGASDNGTSDVLRELLDAFSPSDLSGTLDLTNLINVMLLAERLNIAEVTPLGQAFIFSQPPSEANPSDLLNAQQRFIRNRMRSGVGQRSSNHTQTPARARNELQFHAMLLTPHQIEIIFVLCTLLSGRRKILVQETLLKLGFDDVLRKLFGRMSWFAPPYTGPNIMEHIHGANCECNPENAVRVQVLRLIHSYFDRDFMGNSNKFALLSQREREFLREDVAAELSDAEADSGLLSQVAVVLARQGSESTYRFWLSACIENFLRGCGRKGQMLFKQRGVLLSTVRGILNFSPSSQPDLNYQTSFDLVGELIKCNPAVLQSLEEDLTDEEFRAWIRVCLDNLVDSNVFLRSLLLTVELNHLDYVEDHRIRGSVWDQYGFLENALTARHSSALLNTRSFGYLSASWAQEMPSESEKAKLQFSANSETSYKRRLKMKGKRNSTSVTALARQFVNSLTFDFSQSPAIRKTEDLEPDMIWASSEVPVVPAPRYDDVSGFFTPPESSEEMTEHRAPLSSTVAVPLTVQRNLFRATMFLKQEKVSLLLRLMCSVSVYTINHENICCLNTALLVLLFERERNTLSTTLEMIRTEADRQSPVVAGLKALRRNGTKDVGSLDRMSLCIHLLSDNRAVEVAELGDNCACGNLSDAAEQPETAAKKADVSLCKRSLKRLAVDQAIKSLQPAGNVRSNSPIRNSDIVMENFRELLWYWKEYYHRRGRDRLSIEFSCHIPFRKFQSLVDELCRDNGDDQSLLSSHIAFPVSPYEQSNLHCLLDSRSFSRFPAVLHLH